MSRFTYVTPCVNICMYVYTYIHANILTHPVAYLKLISQRGNKNWKLHQNKMTGVVHVASIIKINEIVMLLARGHPPRLQRCHSPAG